MMPDLITLEPLTVAGLTVRTSNDAEMRPGTARIPDLWAQFFREGIAERVARSVDAPPYAVYWGYESDASGEYCVTAGVALTIPRVLATDITIVEIEGGDYLVFRARGPVPQAVREAWAQVWAHFAGPGPYRRRFTTDFEHYETPDVVAVYVAVRASDRQGGGTS